MTQVKLYKLRRWTLGSDTGAGFFTCARPGRKFSKRDPVSDEVVRKWVLSVTALGPRPAIISLLGRKPDGMSEYSFYSFFGGFDEASDFPRMPSFGEWLTAMDPGIVLVEHPTTDLQSIPGDALDAIKTDVLRLVSEERTVPIVDSGGETRTRQVYRHLGAREAFPTIT